MAASQDNSYNYDCLNAECTDWGLATLPLGDRNDKLSRTSIARATEYDNHYQSTKL